MRDVALRSHCPRTAVQGRRICETRVNNGSKRGVVHGQLYVIPEHPASARKTRCAAGFIPNDTNLYE